MFVFYLLNWVVGVRLFGTGDLQKLFLKIFICIIVTLL